jgi:hypothetical protein
VPRPAVWLALALSAALAAVAAEVRADPVSDRFTAAVNRIGEGREAEAAAELAALARDEPDHELAPEALFSAAELYEDRLADPARALALYRELGERYPDSRRSLAASRRAAALSAQTAGGADAVEAQRRFLVIRQGFAGRPEAESFAMADALVREHPGWAGAPAVALWVAAIEARQGRYAIALRRYLDAAERYPVPEVRFDALRGAGDMALRLGRYDEAARHYRALDPGDDPGRRAAIDEALGQVVSARGRSRWFALSASAVGAGFLALVISLVVAARSPRVALRSLWPPPTEVLYLVPVALILGALSWADFQGLGPAVTAISTAGTASAWISGAALGLRRRRGSRMGVAVAVHALAAALAVIGMVYAAMYENELIDPILDTIRFGPES